MISPADAAVALRSYPRRWKGAFAVVEDEDEGLALLDRGSPSANELRARAVGRMEAARAQVHRIRTADDPDLTAAGPSTGDLEAAALALAEDVEGLPSDDWSRTGRLDGATVTALELVSDAVQGVSDDLRQAERTLRDQVGRG